MSHPRRSRMARGSCRRRRSKVKGFPVGKLSLQATDEGRACGGSPYTGRRRKLAPHPASGGASATFPHGGRHVHLYLLIHQKPEPDLCRQAFTFRKPGCAVGGGVPVIGRHGEQILHTLPFQRDDSGGLNGLHKRKAVVFGLSDLISYGQSYKISFRPNRCRAVGTA